MGSLTGAVASQNVTEARARYARAGRQPAFRVQEHKRARLREGHLGQARKRVLVIRRPGAERPSLNGQKVLRGEQADLAQESTSTARFGTSMSAHRILGLEQVPRVRLFAV